MDRHELDDMADELLERPADVRRAAEALAALAAVPPFMKRGYPLEARRIARRAAAAVAALGPPDTDNDGHDADQKKSPATSSAAR